MKPILLDTHVAIWALEGALDRITQSKINEAAATSNLLLSPITAWEIGMLSDKRKIELPVPPPDYVRKLFFGSRAKVAALSPEIALSARLCRDRFMQIPPIGSWSRPPSHTTPISILAIAPY